ncbi:zinc finger protein 585A-like isoform X2 [Hetaerina americana]
MGPPLLVCRKCIAMLDVIVDFISQVVAAQKKINAIFKVLQDVKKLNVHSTQNKDPSIPAFITYFRSKNYKELDAISKTPNQEPGKVNRHEKRDIEIPETEKEESQCNKHPVAVGHIAKKVDDPVSSLGVEKRLSKVNEITASDQPIVVLSGDGSLGNDVSEPSDDLSERVEDSMETDASSSAPDEADQAPPEGNAAVSTSPDLTSDEPMVESSKEVYGNVCKYCDRSFRYNAELLFHHTSAHQEFVFCCRVCFKVFYDDKEEFKKHVVSHSANTEAGIKGLSSGNTSSDSDPSSAPSEVDDCGLQSPSKTREQVHLNYICKYCSSKYSKLNDLFSHQTVFHPDLVFRCSHCLKVFYENEEELHKHEESHGIHRSKSSKPSEGTDRIMGKDLSGASVVYSTLTEKQQEWVNRILSEKPKKKGSYALYNTLSSAKENACISPSENAIVTPPENADSNISSPVDSNANISSLISKVNFPHAGNIRTLSSVKASINFLPTASMSTALDYQDKVAHPTGESSPSKCYSVKVLNPGNSTQSAKVIYQRVKSYICRPCQIEFKTDEERELHRLFHHRLKLPCRFCPRTLAHKSKLLEHEATHFRKPKLECKKCKEEFENVDILKKHRRTHSVIHTLPRFSCQICKRLYIREKELKIHLESHLDERPFLCEKCGQCFKDVPSLKEHRSTPCKARGFSKSYECDVCEKKFHNARLLSRHRILQHTALYPCPLCGLIFRSRPAMNSHMEGHSKMLCLVCDEPFETLDQLQKHRKQQHPEEEMTEFSAFQCEGPRVVPKLMCSECDKCFATELTLSIHKATHSNESVWQCHLCNEKFDSKYQLENHMSSHPGERPYKCSICDRTFATHRSLLKHEKVHFQEEGYSCNNCHKSFSTAVEFSNHLVEHISYNPFTCKFCPMSFSRKICLLMHQRSHTKRVYSCSSCSENFSQLKLLQEHERTHAQYKGDTEMAATDMDEDSLAVSLLNMSETIVGVGSDDRMLEEVIKSAHVDQSDHVAGNEVVNTTIVIDPEYSEVVYVTDELETIL